MKKKTIQVPVTEFKQVTTGTKPKDIYIAKDGREFNDELSCISHELRLDAINMGHDLFEAVLFDTIDEELDNKMVRLLFNGYSVSDAEFFKTTVSHDKEYIKVGCDYLRAKHCQNVYDSLFTEFKEGDIILIASWSDSAESDYPSYYTHAMLLSDAITKISKINNFLTSL